MSNSSKSSTAAPKKKAKAKIRVINNNNNTPIFDAYVVIHNQDMGNTDQDGIWTSKFFIEGKYLLEVVADGFYPRYSKEEDFPNATAKKPINNLTVRMVQVNPRAIVTVTDPSRGNSAVPGAKVFVDVTPSPLFPLRGTTELNGIYISPGFINIGKWYVSAFKPGYGLPAGSNPPVSEGQVGQWVDFNKVEDKPIKLELASIWGRVKSSNITVGNKHFVDWFNDDFRSRMPKKLPGKKNLTFPGKISKGGFTNVFDNCEKVWAAELTIEEFIGLCMIIYNETGGGFEPISEKGSPKYMFEPIKGVKGSYNQGGNRKAGDLLKGMGFISTDKEVAQWNGQVWPAPAVGSDLYNAALECDFYKFRGRGLIQITWRSNYLAYVDPYLVAAGKKKSDDMTDKELEAAILNTPDVYLGMTKSYLKAVRASYVRVNLYDWKKFAFSIAGNNPLYAELFEWRCTNLFSEMRKDGFKLG